MTADSYLVSAVALAAEKAGVEVKAPENIPTIIALNSSLSLADFFPI